MRPSIAAAGVQGGKVNKTAIKLYYEPKDRLRLTVQDDRSYVIVKPVWASPVSRPGRFLFLLDGKGEEIVMLTGLEELDHISRRSVEQELRRRYLTATVTAILSARQEFGATYWEVDTDRGRREFVTQSLQENAQWFSDTHLLVLDVDGNRFEIPDIQMLDLRSRALIDLIL